MDIHEINKIISSDEVTWGFGIKDKGNILIWDKPYYMQQVIDRLRCLNDILKYGDEDSTSAIGFSYIGLQLTVKVLIDGLEKNKFSRGTILENYLTKYCDLRKDWHFDDADMFIQDVDDFIECACDNINHSIFNKAYKEDIYVHEYMKKFYEGVTYLL